MIDHLLRVLSVIIISPSHITSVGSYLVLFIVCLDTREYVTTIYKTSKYTWGHWCCFEKKAAKTLGAVFQKTRLTAQLPAISFILTIQRHMCFYVFDIIFQTSISLPNHTLRPPRSHRACHWHPRYRTSVEKKSSNLRNISRRLSLCGDVQNPKTGEPCKYTTSLVSTLTIYFTCCFCSSTSWVFATRNPISFWGEATSTEIGPHCLDD